MSAPIIEVAPLEPAARVYLRALRGSLVDRVERFLENERGQLPLWFVVAIGSGIAGWFAFPGPRAWVGLMIVGTGLAFLSFTFPGSRIGRSLIGFGIGLALGCALAWLRSERMGAARLNRIVIGEVNGSVEGVETLAAKGDLRLTVRPDQANLPPRIRLSMPDTGSVVVPGQQVSVRARLTPPPPMALPGGHDFARDFWFKGIGATGRAIGPAEFTGAGQGSGMDRVRAGLDRTIRNSLPGPSGGIATALATGDQHAVGTDDAEAMRRSGLTHLLSVSGLHIAAVVGAAILLSLRLLALSERLALRLNLVLVSAAVGAASGIGYTWLTGMQVPTVRSCIAALLVLGGIALGRDAISLRLIAVGALAVMIFRPEAVPGASFQFSFAAVTAIVALHGLPVARRLLSARDDTAILRLGRGLMSLVATGLAVEIALIPLALYHFHKAGLYGVAANLFAIPWTTFVVMPLEAAALLFDLVGLGAPFWAATGWAIDQLLAVAHFVSGLGGAVAMLPAMPRPAFGLIVMGGLWVCLWQGRARRWGVVPMGLGMTWALLTPIPDLLITGDGRHVAVVENGRPLLLRGRSGDFTRSIFEEAAGFDGDSGELENAPGARCNRDSCVAIVTRGGRAWHILAIRSRDRIRWETLTDACRRADIVIADRRLPRGCIPRWLKADRTMLSETGGLAIRFGRSPAIDSVGGRTSGHPWAPGAQ